MKKPDRDPGRGQLNKRSARAWRDEDNPTGPGVAKEEPEPESESSADEAAAGRDQALAQEQTPVDEPVNAGPGGGGATQSAGRAKHHEGLHGGPSRKP